MNLSIGELEHKLKISLGLISRWKKTSSQFSFTTILKILDCLNITMLFNYSKDINGELWDAFDLLTSSNVDLIGKKLIIKTINQQIAKYSDSTNFKKGPL